MTEETRIALINYDDLVRTRGVSDIGLFWDTNTLVYGDGGCLMDELCRPGFTDATTPEGLAARMAPPLDESPS